MNELEAEFQKASDNLSDKKDELNDLLLKKRLIWLTFFVSWAFVAVAVTSGALQWQETITTAMGVIGTVGVVAGIIMIGISFAGDNE